jgi:acyl dehydratase
MRVIGTKADLLALDGQELGTSEWHEVTQVHVDHFAEATGNKAPIHTDPEYAAATPLGGTLAFGIQILAMATYLLSDIWELRGVVGGADLGTNRVRHLSPVRTGQRVRLLAKIAKAEPSGDRGVRVTFDLAFEVEGGERPACVAEIVFVYELAESQS